MLVVDNIVPSSPSSKFTAITTDHRDIIISIITITMPITAIIVIPIIITIIITIIIDMSNTTIEPLVSIDSEDVWKTRPRVQLKSPGYFQTGLDNLIPARIDLKVGE